MPYVNLERAVRMTHLQRCTYLMKFMSVPWKTDLERIYCMRFARDIARIDAIDVRIEIFVDGNSMHPCIDPIAYRLQEVGYPSYPAISMSEICPDIKLTGSMLKEKLEVEDEK